MRQRLYIYLLALSLTVMLGIPFVKHHHHGSTVCTAVEYCSEDHAENDRHTSHRHDRTACTERGEYVISRQTDSHDSQTIHINLAATMEPYAVTKPESAEFRRQDFAPAATPRLIAVTHVGMRAPPNC